MDIIVLEYRDPIVGIISIVFLVFLISFFTYSYGIYKEKRARKDYRKLSKRFELGNLKENDYVNLYKTYNLPFDSILLLASSLIHKGDINKAISVYLALLEHVKDRVKKEELLELLGQSYLKSGFLQRSSEIFLEILKFSPRNKNALKNLVIINERLKNYKKAREILDSLDELNVDTKLDKVYFDTLIIINDSILSYERRSELLFTIFMENKEIQRLFARFLLSFNKDFFYKNISNFDCKKLIDIFWYQKLEDINLKIIENNVFLKDLYTAKAYIQSSENSEDFALNIMILLNKYDKKVAANLSFEFICKSCKQSFVFYESRCPKCQSILSLEVKHHLIKALNPTNQSLQ